MLPRPRRPALWSQLAAAVHAARPAARALPEDARDEQLLLRLGEELPRFEAVEPLLEYTVTELGAHLGAAAGCLEHDSTTRTSRVRAEHRSAAEPFHGEHPFSQLTPQLCHELARGRTLSITDTQHDLRTRDLYPQRHAARALLAVPVLRERVWVATFYLLSPQVRFWTRLEQQLAETVAERAWLWVERIRMLRALRASERKYRQLIENTSEGVWEIDAQGCTRFVNARMAALLGYTEPELLGAPFTRFMDETWRREALALLERRRSGLVEAHDFGFRRRDGSLLWARVEASPVLDEGGQYQGALAMVSDISERKQAEADQAFLLGLSEVFASASEPSEVCAQVVRRLGAHLAIDRCLIARIDPESAVASVEQEWRREGLPPLTGTHSLAMYGGVMPGITLVGDCRTDPRTREHADAYRALGLAAFAAVPMLRDGKARAVVVLGSMAPFEWTPRIVGLARVLVERSMASVQRLESVAALRDMSRELERRVEARTAQLTALVAEKEVLLKEIHHRVKNNLQVISSLLNLQSMHIADASAAAVLAESRGRVHSIALVHEILYESQELSRLDFANYIRALVQTVVQAQSVPGCVISAVIETESVRMPLATAIPCGLLINELITNSLKHAFAGRSEGCIRVRLSQVADQRAQLEVADDGVGLPEREEERERRSLGLDLVYTFAEQLGAEVRVEREYGTRFCFSFATALLPDEPTRGS